MPIVDTQALIRERMATEVGRIHKHAPFRVALVYPSPYRAGMSSLGYLQIYKAIQNENGMACERAFLPDDTEAETGPLVTYETLTPVSDLDVIALSVAYELELAGVIQVLERSGLNPLRDDRRDNDPIVIAGGPLTFSNPMPLSVFVDAIVMGEGDTVAVECLRIIRESKTKRDGLEALARLDHVYVPALESSLKSLAQCDDELLPAWAPIQTPHAELTNMFLIETERGCSRGCTYCVMRRSTNGGMRVVEKERILALIPQEATRVGLVGAAVSDHPKIAEIVRSLAESGREVGLSSLRPDRLNDEFVGALQAAGHRTLTTAMDGVSERVRETLERRARIRHLEKAAELARHHKMARLKLYLMVGVPGEEDSDIDECVSFVTELSKRVPIALGIAPFCPKRNTPLSDAEFAGIEVVNRRLSRLRRGLRGRADVRATSARWAWVEAVLAKGGAAEGRAVAEAVQGGATFQAYERAFSKIERAPRRRLSVLPSPGL